MSAPIQPPEDLASQRQPPSRLGEAAGTALALGAIAQGLPDPFLPLRWRSLVQVVRAEQKLVAAFTAVIRSLAPRMAREVFSHGVVDPVAALQVKQSMLTALEPQVEVVLHEVMHDGFVDWSDESRWEPDALAQVYDYIAGARNRMVNTPDSVFSMIKREMAKAAREGASMDDFAAQIDKIFLAEGVSAWQNRALTVARTELIGAYNAGTFAGMVSEAKQVGGDWEKLWLSTEDQRVRPTHHAADFHLGSNPQRVNLFAPFIVGGFPLMFPGDPSGPPQEVINCRCVPLMVRPGEHPTMTNRHYKGKP